MSEVVLGKGGARRDPAGAEGTGGGGGRTRGIKKRTATCLLAAIITRVTITTFCHNYCHGNCDDEYNNKIMVTKMMTVMIIVMITCIVIEIIVVIDMKVVFS